MNYNDLDKLALPSFGLLSKPSAPGQDAQSGLGDIYQASVDSASPAQKTRPIQGSSLTTGKKFTIEFEPKIDYSAYNEQILADINKRRSARVGRLVDTDIRATPLVASRSSTTATVPMPTKGETQQFMNKYHPRCYSDLVTNEKANREILQWLIQWKHHIGTAGSGEIPTPIIIICGPPGSGKTTMATVLGRQAGFDIVDINHNEDFSGAIKNAFSFNNSIFSTKPSMVLIEEADEFSNASASVLLNLIKNTKRVHGTRHTTFSSSSSSTRNMDFGDYDEEGMHTNESERGEGESGVTMTSTAATAGKRKKKRKTVTTINKPIICTCTNLYAPVLRELRQECTVFQIGNPSQQRFTEVLRGVCKKEGLNVDGDLLIKLGQISNYDMRSILFDLEFIKKTVGSDSKKRITVETFNKISVGEKDMETSIFDIWDRVFFNAEDITNDPALSFRTSTAQEKRSTKAAAAKHAGAFFNTVYGNDSQERILEGCWLNYLKMHQKRLDFKSVLPCIEAASYADLVSGRSFRSTSSVSFFTRSIGYATAVAEFRLVFNKLALFSNAHYTRKFDVFEYPRVHSQMYKRRKDNLLIADSFFGGISSESKRWTYKNTIETELLPCVLAIATPAVKQTNTLLMTTAEVKLLGTVADAFYELGLKYNTKYAEGAAKSSTNILEPPLDALARFGEDSVVPREFPHASLKKEVHRLVNLRALRAHQDAQSMLDDGKSDVKKDTVKKEAKKETEKKEVKKEVVEPPVKKKRDFFGRIVEVPQIAHDGSGGGAGGGAAIVPKFKPVSRTNLQKMVPLPPQPVKYKFQEGFTNAVRRKLKISDLL